MEVDSSCVPPGFRFHPTEVELVGYYLARKVASRKIDFEVIADIDLYRIEPWDLQGRCKLVYEEQNEWYFFSHKDKKYPTGTRTNRATSAGFWKATGRDKAVVSNTRIIGMRKTLVFYVGRAPNGRKTDWIIHEYRLQSNEDDPPQEEGWVVCRAFKKQTPNQRPGLFNTSNPNYYVKGHNQFGLEGFTDFPQSSTQFMESFFRSTNPQEQPLKGAFENKSPNSNSAFEIPGLDSPTLFTGFETNECFDAKFTDYKEYRDHIRSENDGQFVDWKVLDKLLASQMSESTSCSSPNITSQHDEFLNAPFDS